MPARRGASDLGADERTMILVIAEQRQGKLNRATWEAVTAAQQLAHDEPITIVVLGSAVDAVAKELASARAREVVAVDETALETYTPDGYTAALQIVVEQLAPSAVVLAHTYQTRDFAPKLAARLDRALITDVTAIKVDGSAPAFVRPMFQGKLTADVVPDGPSPHFITCQIGSFRAEQAAKGSAPAPIRRLEVQLPADSIRQKPEPPFQEARQSVDLSQAERIVAVGRGIKEQDRLPVAQQLAEALHAEIAASRPICDAGWLPMERQVGSSGQTVAPKLYVALGISGAIQHLVGMKGSQVVAAINKDPDAPIFEIADYGIVGDLFEVVPALVSALKQ